MTKCSICKRELKSDEPVNEYKGRATCDPCWLAAFKADWAKEHKPPVKKGGK